MEKRNNSQESAKNVVSNKEAVDEQIRRFYKLHRQIGNGAYGIVYKASHAKTNKTVAIKKIFNAFTNETDAKRTYREIYFLREFRSHPNIITLFTIHKSSSLKDIYLIFECMDTDLHYYIKQGKKLEVEHIRYITYQILKGLKFIHSGDVIHRDLKPANILLNARCEAKIADFGLARCIRSKDRLLVGHLTEYVATRWYRAPEILLGCSKYTTAIDLWSVGCILAEMIRSEPLFPGTSTVNQLELIMSAFPETSQREINHICTGIGKKILEWSPQERVNLKKLFIDTPCDLLDLTFKCLKFNPKRRLDALGGLKHPFVKMHHNPFQEPIFGRPLFDDGWIQRHLARTRGTYGEIDMLSLGRPYCQQQVAPIVDMRKITRLPVYQRITRNPSNPVKPHFPRTSISLNNYIKQDQNDHMYYSEMKKFPNQWLKVNAQQRLKLNYND